jgi:NAD-dependent SIR2 family protein deacetylase
VPTCQNCESVVTESYVRVFAPNGMDQPRVCPACSDKIREKGSVREKRN